MKSTHSLDAGIGRLLATAAFLFLPLAAFAPNGLAPLLAVTAALVLGILCLRGWVPAGAGPVGIILAAGFVYALASAWWADHPIATLRLLPGLGATLLGGMLLARAVERLDEDGRRRVRRALILGGAIGYALMAFELATNGLLHRSALQAVGIEDLEGYQITLALKRGTTVAMLFAGPFGLALYREVGRAAALAGAGLGLATAAAGLSATAVTAGLVGLAVFGLALLRGRATALALMAVLALGIAGSPWIPGLLPDPTRSYEKVTFLSNSGIHRLAIWGVAADHIAERPVFGHGLNAARTLYPPGSAAPLPFYTSDGILSFETHFEPIPLHPHNGTLQVWLELGAVGAAFLLGVVLFALRAIMARGPGSAEQAAALGTFAAAFLVYSVGFGAWQSWWLCGLFLLATWTLATLARPR